MLTVTDKVDDKQCLNKLKDKEVYSYSVDFYTLDEKLLIVNRKAMP